MKKHAVCGLLVLVFSVGLLLSSCGNNYVAPDHTDTQPSSTAGTQFTENTAPSNNIEAPDPTEAALSNTGKIFYKDFVFDDLKSLDHIKAYDLNELASFFEGRMMNEFTDVPVLTFTEVNAQFPIEIIRTGDYSVYKVTQGGYYYIFWVSSLEDGNAPEVYFATYIDADRSPDLFESITPKVSTAADIKAIDPYCEISVLGSSPYIFSYINPDTAYLFWCQWQGGDHWKSIVKSIILFPREKTNCFSKIQSKDLP